MKTIALLAAWLALPALAADPPKLTTEQKLEWSEAVNKALMAETAVHRVRQQADAEIKRLEAEQAKAAQAAQTVADKLVRAACAIPPGEKVAPDAISIGGDVKCPPAKK